MQVGAMIDYKIGVRGLPMRWTSEITAWDPGVRFVDEQRRGPYRKWVHEHRFTPIASGHGVIVEDDVRYAVPGGALTNALFVRPDLNRIFAFRMRKLIELFGGRELRSPSDAPIRPNARPAT
jgi:ligand-binding SRPBCC domain-containing protein